MWSADLYLGSVTLPSNSWLMVYGNLESRSHQYSEFEDFLIILGLSPLPLGNFTHKLGWTKSFQRKLFSVFGHRGAEGLMVIYFIEKGVGGQWRLESLDTVGASAFLAAAGLGFQKKQYNKPITLATSWPQILLFWRRGSNFWFCAGTEVVSTFIYRDLASSSHLDSQLALWLSTK